MSRQAFWAAIASLVLFASPVLAAPCTNNGWQPTFVHDLDTDDTPFYVTGGMSFVPLQWVPNGGYVPHACQLVRSPRDLRDPRGFTTCQQYTRVQCGCSRSLPGNSTCEAFLRWHNPPPRSSAASPAPGGARVAPPIPAPPAFPGPRVAPPIPASPPPRAGPPSSAAITVPASPNAWRQAPQYAGRVYASQLGLAMQGGAWSNGRLQNGVYDGNRVFSAQGFDLSNGGDVYMKFLANGAGQYMGFWPRLFEGVSVLHMTTHHSWANSVVVPDNAWIFGHLRVEPGGSYQIAISGGAYDDRGGQVIYRNAGRLTNPRGRLEMQFADNYAGQQAGMVIGEATVRTGGGGSPFAPSQPYQAPQPRQQQQGGARSGAGASCSANSQCASSICLLGVCAP